MHALTIVILSIIIMYATPAQMADENQFFYTFTVKVVTIDAALFSLCLVTFCIYQIFALGLNNVASNEDIRHRWNGHRRNKKAVKLYKKEAGCCGRFAYLLFGDVDSVQGRSRLQKYAELVETFYEIQKLGEGRPTP